MAIEPTSYLCRVDHETAVQIPATSKREAAEIAAMEYAKKYFLAGRPTTIFVEVKLDTTTQFWVDVTIVGPRATADIVYRFHAYEVVMLCGQSVCPHPQGEDKSTGE